MNINASIRLAILQILESDPGYSVNHRIMRSYLEGTRAFSLTFDQVKTHYQWLADQGLVTLEDVGEYAIARLTAEGQEAAKGHKTVPGIARPLPA